MMLIQSYISLFLFIDTRFYDAERWVFLIIVSFFCKGIQVGMGPAGELRYPFCPPEQLAQASHSHLLGEFHCYDKVHQ